VWIGAAVSLTALILAFRGIDWSTLIDALRQADYVYMLPAALFMLAAIAARAERWRWLLGGRDKVGPWRSFRAVSIGYLMTNVLPFRLGELVRPIVISRGGRLSAMQALSSIAVEHVLDVLMILAMLAIVVPDLPLPSAVADGARLSAIVFGGAAVVMLLLVIWHRPVERVVERLLNLIPRLNTQVWLRRFNSAMAGLGTLRNPRLFAASSLWSLIAWLASAVSFYFAMLSFVPDASFTAAVFVTITSSLVLLVPSTPGYIGVLEWAIRDSLLIFGWSPEVGLAYAIGFHFMELVVMNVSGVVCMIAEGMSWSMAVSEARRAEAKPEPLAVAEEGG
jgi:hypothetical protein